MNNAEEDAAYRGAGPFFTPTNPNVSGGDATGGDALSQNANRAFAWFIAGIVASIIVSILLMLVTFLFGINFSFRNGLQTEGSPVLLVVTLLLSVGIGFATGGAVYESWVGCPSKP